MIKPSEQPKGNRGAVALLTLCQKASQAKMVSATSVANQVTLHETVGARHATETKKTTVTKKTLKKTKKRGKTKTRTSKKARVSARIRTEALPISSS